MSTKSIPDKIRDELYSVIEDAQKAYYTEQQQNTLLSGNKLADFTRTRKLSFEIMLKLLISMQGGCIAKELHRAGLNVSASAFVQRRKQINWQDFERVFENFTPSKEELKTYKGYRILAVDGSALNIARDPKAESYMINKSSPDGYNQVHINPLYDILNKQYVSCVIQPQPKMDEIGALAFMLSWYNCNDKTIIVGDRGYESYLTFRHFMEAGNNTKFLIRIRQGHGAMKKIAELPMTELDTHVSFVITNTQTKADKASGYIYVPAFRNKNRILSDKLKNVWNYESPYNMEFRVVRFMLSTGEYETLATNLPDTFTFDDIRNLYRSRWGIEISFRNLKYSVGLLNLHGKSDDFARQEIFSSMIFSNFCNRIVNQVVLQQKDENCLEYQVNMKMAVYLCREYLQMKNPDGEQLMNDIAKYTEAVRPDREDERKLKSKGFISFVYRIAS